MDAHSDHGKQSTDELQTIVWCFNGRLQNVFIIGKGDKPLISLPKGKGVRLNILQEQAKRDAAKAA